MQAWGISSKFTERKTELQPSKSGVLGLIAAALGRRRVDPIEDLLPLKFAVRLDQPGVLLKDFQTASREESKPPISISNRYYLADAIFIAAIEGENQLIQSVASALEAPTFPLYLGRRSCPPTLPLTIAYSDADLIEVIATTPWAASQKFRRQYKDHETFSAEVVRDAFPGEEIARFMRDVPESFNPEKRLYGFRAVNRYFVDLLNPDYQYTIDSQNFFDHDPMEVIEN
jgi:CRISPR system Cascade subunit CasD